MFLLGTQMKMTLLLGLGLKLQGSGLIKPFGVVKTEYLQALSKLSGNGWGMWKQEVWQDQGPGEHCPAHGFSKLDMCLSFSHKGWHPGPTLSVPVTWEPGFARGSNPSLPLCQHKASSVTGG